MKKLNVFQPFGIASTGLYDWCGKASRNKKTAEVLKDFMSKDPGATDWSSMGLICPLEEDKPVHDLDGAARVMCFQFNERILPGSVRDEKLRDEVKRITEKQGFAMNKKQFAEVKEDLEHKLLPKAFIRRTQVAVMVYPRHIFIFTASMKKVEDILAKLASLAMMRKVEFEPHTMDLSTKVTVGHVLTEAVRSGSIEESPEEDASFIPLNAGVFKGADKRAVRIKNRDMDSKEVMDLLDNGYSASELFMDMRDGADESTLTFTLTDRFIFKAIKLSDVQMSSQGLTEDDKHGFWWLLAKTYTQLVMQIMYALNEGGEDGEPTTEQEDEL